MNCKAIGTVVSYLSPVSCTHQTPLEVLLLLCIPVVDPDKEDRNWRRPLNCLHLITAPLVCVLAFQSGRCKCVTFHDGGSVKNVISFNLFFPLLFQLMSRWRLHDPRPVPALAADSPTGPFSILHRLLHHHQWPASQISPSKYLFPNLNSLVAITIEL